MCLALLVALAVLPPPAPGEPEPPDAPDLCLAASPELRLCYRNHEWTPERLGRAEDGSSPSRPWPLATMEVRQPLRLDETDLSPGCYAWVCVVDAHGRSAVELRRLLLPDAVLPEPEDVDWVRGEPVWDAPIRFDTALGVSPRLTISLTPGRGGVRLEVRYGEGRLVRELLRR